MKILHLGKFYPPHRGGIETATQCLAETGVQLGHEVSCIVSAAGGDCTEAEVVNHVTVKRLATFGQFLSAPLTPAFFTGRLPEVDLLHVHLSNPLAEVRSLYFVSRRMEKNSSVKVVPFIHSLPVRQGWIGRFWFSNITARLLDLSDQILISHAYQLQAFPQLWRWKEKIQVVPYMTEVLSDGEFEVVQEKRKNSLRVVAIGRLVGYKGFDILLKAWARFSKKFTGNLHQLSLKIAGEGPEKSVLKQLIHELGLEKSVTLLGNITDSEKNNLLEESVLFVAPSTTCAETFGISILEAMSKGLPVITTTLPTGVAALARQGRCGAVASPGSVEELSHALEKLLNSPSSLQEAGYKNLLFVRDNFSAETVKRYYQKFLNSLCFSGDLDKPAQAA